MTAMATQVPPAAPRLLDQGSRLAAAVAGPAGRKAPLQLVAERVAYPKLYFVDTLFLHHTAAAEADRLQPVTAVSVGLPEAKHLGLPAAGTQGLEVAAEAEVLLPMGQEGMAGLEALLEAMMGLRLAPETPALLEAL